MWQTIATISLTFNVALALFCLHQYRLVDKLLVVNNELLDRLAIKLTGKPLSVPIAKTEQTDKPSRSLPPVLSLLPSVRMRQRKRSLKKVPTDDDEAFREARGEEIA